MSNITYIKNPKLDINPAKKPLLIHLQHSSTNLPSLLKSYDIVVVYVYGEWCRPCKIVGPKYMEMAKSLINEPNIIFCKDDISSPHTNFNGKSGFKKVNGVPSLFIFYKGQEAQYILGGDIEKLTEDLNKLLDANADNCPPISTNLL